MSFFLQFMFWVINFTIAIIAINAIYYILMGRIVTAIKVFVAEVVILILQCTFVTIFFFGGTPKDFACLYSKYSMKSMNSIIDLIPTGEGVKKPFKWVVNKSTGLVAQIMDCENHQPPPEQSDNWKVTDFKVSPVVYGSGLSEGWVKLRMSNLGMTGENEAMGSVQFENTKSIFMSLDNTGGHNFNCNIEGGTLIYPKEKLSFPNALTFNAYCNSNGNGSDTRFECNFSRGNIIAKLNGQGITKEELILLLGLQVGGFMNLNPFSSYNLELTYSNDAVEYSVFNLFWTAFTGEWIKRDIFENLLSGIGGLVTTCPECKLFLSQYKLDGISINFLKTCYRKSIDAPTALKILLKTSVLLLESPGTSDAAYKLLCKFLPDLAGGGAAAMAAKLTVIIDGGWRILALVPQTWDVLNTSKVEDISGIDIKAVCTK